MTQALFLFDCNQTLIYKKNLETKIRDFLFKELGKKVPIKFIKYALNIMYQRHKFSHPLFSDFNGRVEYYKEYNKEQLRIIGIDISDSLAIKLNGELKKLPFGIFSDVIETLNYLKGKYRLGVLANWTETLDSILVDLDLKHYFDFMVSSNDLGVTKPDINFFIQSLKKIKTKKFSDIFYIGDDYELDILPILGAKTKLRPILIDRLTSYPDVIDCKKIKTLDELKNILEQN